MTEPALVIRGGRYFGSVPAHPPIGHGCGLNVRKFGITLGVATRHVSASLWLLDVTDHGQAVIEVPQRGQEHF